MKRIALVVFILALAILPVQSIRRVFPTAIAASDQKGKPIPYAETAPEAAAMLIQIQTPMTVTRMTQKIRG